MMNGLGADVALSDYVVLALWGSQIQEPFSNFGNINPTKIGWQGYHKKPK
jgi:hypothetical protein